MPFYALTYITVDDFANKRSPFREEHLKLAKDFFDNKILIMGGSMEPAIEALLIFKCDTEDTVKLFMQQDPYVQQGLVKAWYIREWNVVIGG